MSGIPADAAQGGGPQPDRHPLRDRIFLPAYGIAVSGVILVVLTGLTGELRLIFLAAGIAIVGSFIALKLSGLSATRDLTLLTDAADAFLRGHHSDIDVSTLGGSREVRRLADMYEHLHTQVTEIDSRDRRFLMSVSHELRTPLTAINGHAQALRDGLADDPDARDRSLEVIEREAARLERLVGDIIDLARIRSNRFSTTIEGVELADLGAHLLAIFPETGAGSPTVQGTFGEVYFHSDGERILQILRNLVNNALRYADTHVTVTGARERAHVLISVANDGEPIDAGIRERMFEPFVGAKREGGMGLGLAISRELAWALGGELRLAEDPSETRFELTLPLEPPGSGR